ncbi:UNVERIFIED_CONTAM: hypothetical protein Slati_3107500 [Sesamum latifolium]|uniref:Uncharacterized protein n=1 Tax=Sesamum latifolium TaxID=2727402 RepID=A0AAW2UUN5_9LAMI
MEIGRWLADRQVVSTPGRWLLAHWSRARQVAGCWLVGRVPTRSLAAGSQVD